MNNPTDSDKERGYQVCHCGGVKLLQAGFEVATTMCPECSEHVADSREFFKTDDGVRALSK